MSKKKVFYLLLGIYISLNFNSILATDNAMPNQLIIGLKTQKSRSLKPEKLIPINKNFMHSVKKIKHTKKTRKTSESHYIIQFKEGVNLKKISKKLHDEKNISYVEPNYYVYSYASTNDPLKTHQTHLNQININALSKIPGSSEVIIAIIDTGVDYNHEDLKNQIYINTQETKNGLDDDNNGIIDDIMGTNLLGYSENNSQQDPLDKNGHGTHIAGIIAAKSNNNKGIIGLNNNIKILPIAFLNRQGRGNQVDAAQAIRYAVNQGADIINCSWGFSRYNTILKEAIEYALEKNVIIVAAAGNSSSSIEEYPGSFEGVITIGSLNENNHKSHFSTYGNNIDFMAPGEDVFSTLPNNQYNYKSGSSQSTAIITGIISKILNYSKEFTPKQVKNILIKSSTPLENTNQNLGTGYGKIDIEKLQKTIYETAELESYAHPINQDNHDESIISNLEEDNVLKLDQMTNYPNPFGNALNSESTTFGYHINNFADVEIKIYDIEGRQIHSIIKSKTNSTIGYNKISWNGKTNSGKKLENGVYFYQMKVSSNGKQTSQINKLAVIN